jgi:hypothetical protein
MRVDLGEVKFACDEENDGVHRVEAGVTAGFAFGGLKDAVASVDVSFGLAFLGSGDDAVEVLADHPGSRVTVVHAAG